MDSLSRTKTLDAWYQEQNEDEKRLIDNIGNQLEVGIKTRYGKRKAGFGEKSKIELTYALARFINRTWDEMPQRDKQNVKEV